MYIILIIILLAIIGLGGYLWFILQKKKGAKRPSWAEREVRIACSKGCDEYYNASYRSALKAYKYLNGDGHSGCSISVTKDALNRLIEHKPLTPIEDTEDIWSDRSDISGLEGEVANYQCKRMTSLFKYIYSDGTIKYKDVDSCYCVNIGNPGVSYYSGLVSKIVDEMFPITMPYYPGKPIKVYCDDFLTDPKNGDFDTVGILYLTKPDGENVEVNRFFKESADGWDEINNAEYEEREIMHNARVIAMNRAEISKILEGVK